MKIKLTFVILIFSLSMFGKEIPVEKAKAAATSFLMLNMSTRLKANTHFELTLVTIPIPNAINQSFKKSTPRETLIYFFEINNHEGYILVSGDDMAIPILGYSLEENFDLSKVPDNFRKWIEGYKNQIMYIRSNPANALDETRDQWENLFSGKWGSESKSTAAVAPLITTKWNQGTYYNDLCPFDAEYDQYSATGCVATAMAQILKYWNYPESGNGFHSYNHSEFGVLSANFGSTTYNWSQMPDEVSGQNNAVATLMFHCGVSVEMNYSAPGSYAYVVSDASPLEHCSEFAFKEHFGMEEGTRGIIRENYSTDAWIQLIKSELEEGRPIEYVGFGNGGGHAFICDGYDTNDFFHFNWGWGGYYDGFLAVEALDPTGTGIGGGSGGYNSGQQAVIGIKPPEITIDRDLVLYDALTISDTLVFFADSFNIHTDIGNFGTLTFAGDFCAAIFDEEYNFIEYAEILEGATLEEGMHYTNGLDFSNSGMVSLLPGKYFTGIFYRATGENWKVVGDGLYANFLPFEIYYSSDIELYNDFVISTGSKIIQHKPFTVTTDILNDGASTFTGVFDISLYNMEGELVTTIETISEEPLESNYYYSELAFSSAGVTVEPGTYLMALLHKPDGGSWTLSGSSYYSNPVKVIVAEAPLDPDIYEENDSPGTAYLLELNFSDNVAGVVTEGSNAHVGTDMDYYTMVLDPGFNYSISARVHDSYNSGNQEAYTNDVIWSYTLNDDWSDMYDDVMPGGFNVLGGGEVLFGVVPYYEGETGTYLLDIQVNRQETVSSPDFDESYLRIYPNPVSEILKIESSETIDHIRLFDARGRMIFTIVENTWQPLIDVSLLNSGVYFLHITQQDYTSVHKIMKQ